MANRNSSASTYRENIRNHARAVIAGGVVDLTIIVPTLNEASSLRSLLPTLLELYPQAEILIVDDGSRDGTQQVIESFQECVDEASTLRLLERGDDSIKGLTASVLEGILHTTTKYFVVMDGDLQHPPEHVINNYIQLRSGADIAVSCRLPYREQQPVIRKLATWMSTAISKTVLHGKGIQVHDPMSGFFGGRTVFTKELIVAHRNSFEPRGYKVLFELLRLVGPDSSICENFYLFGVRPGGNSKLRPIHGYYFFRSLFR